jgi:hypothetical protein
LVSDGAGQAGDFAITGTHNFGGVCGCFDIFSFPAWPHSANH